MAHDNVVIVGVDGTEQSSAAVDWAFEQAKRRGAALHIVCAIEVPAYAITSISPVPVSSAEFLKDAATDMLNRECARVRGRGVEVSTAIELGDATEVLTELSKRAALVVLGGRSSRNTIADRLLRTASSAVPSNSYCPTVVVPFDEKRTFQPIEQIVVGVDGSEHARIALQRAVWEADRWGARLMAVMSIPASYAPGGPAIVMRDDVLAEAAELVREEVAELSEQRNIDIEVRTLEGNPSYTLPAFSTKADLIIVGTRGRGGIAGLLLGSTSQMVLGQSTCPVMVVPKRIRDNDDAGTHAEGLVGE